MDEIEKNLNEISKNYYHIPSNKENLLPVLEYLFSFTSFLEKLDQNQITEILEISSYCNKLAQKEKERRETLREYIFIAETKTEIENLQKYLTSL